jgi:serine/threonine protein kinase/Flp pilus assembly protein TadD
MIQLSHYRILEKLGRGGMGEVYLAEDSKLNRKVAIKILSEKYAADDDARRRFLKEAQTVAKLDHPNICAIYETGQHDEQNYIVMQLVEGETLTERTRLAPLPLLEALDVALQVADALAHAHAHNVIHRDVKPQNVMLTAQGRVKVLDFGLAKVAAQNTEAALLDTESLLSQPGLLVGTVPYMSPEQLRSDLLDGRSDIFGLGVLLYEMVSGRQPFARDNTVATMSAIIMDEALPLSGAVPGVPPEFDQLLRKCLAKDREQRYPSMPELIVDLLAVKRQVSLKQSDSARDLRRSGTNQRRNLLALISILLLLVGGLSLYWFLSEKSVPVKSGNGASNPMGPGRNPAIASIAVMPFETVSDDPNAQYLSRGFTEGLINSLSRQAATKVIANSSVSRYEGQQLDPRRVGQELGAEALIAGRFIERGDSLTISLELVDARNNSHLWGRSYSQKIANILSLQEQIFQDVTERLQLNVAGGDKKRIADQHTDNREAYRLYLMGRSAWSKRTQEDLKKSISLFEQAIELDPTYALAYAGLSDSYSSLGAGLQVMPPKEVMPKARAAALKALEFDPNLAEAHVSLALVTMLYDWDLEAAQNEFEKAIDLNPNSATAHNWYAFCLIAMGRLESSNQQSRKAEELDPLSQFFSINVARTFFYARDYDSAISHCRKAIELNPKFYVAHYLLGSAYAKKGLTEQAISEFLIVRTLGGDNPAWTSVLGYAYALAGKRGEALSLLEQLKQQATQRYVSPSNMAFIYQGLGDRKQTLQWLEKSYEERVGVLVYLKIEPAYEDLKGNPDFDSLLRKIDHAQ